MGRTKVDCLVELAPVSQGGKTLPGVRVTCSKCERTEECFGTSDRSVTRALMMLREHCEEEGEANFYAGEFPEAPVNAPARAGRPSGYQSTFQDGGPKLSPSGRPIQPKGPPVKLQQTDSPPAKPTVADCFDKRKVAEARDAAAPPDNSGLQAPWEGETDRERAKRSGSRYWLSEAAGKGVAGYGGAICVSGSSLAGRVPVEVLQVGDSNQASWACDMLNSHAELLAALGPFLESFQGMQDQMSLSEPVRFALKAAEEAGRLQDEHPGM